MTLQGSAELWDMQELDAYLKARKLGVLGEDGTVRWGKIRGTWIGLSSAVEKENTAKKDNKEKKAESPTLWSAKFPMAVAGTSTNLRVVVVPIHHPESQKMSSLEKFDKGEQTNPPVLIRGRLQETVCMIPGAEFWFVQLREQKEEKRGIINLFKKKPKPKSFTLICSVIRPRKWEFSIASPNEEDVVIEGSFRGNQPSTG